MHFLCSSVKNVGERLTVQKQIFRNAFVYAFEKVRIQPSALMGMIARALHNRQVHSGAFTDLVPRLSLTVFRVTVSFRFTYNNWEFISSFLLSTCVVFLAYSLLLFSPFNCSTFWFVLCRLAKATLTLIPLFGIHEIIFIFATDEQTTGILRYIKVFFTLTLNSFQVGLTSVCCYLWMCDPVLKNTDLLYFLINKFNVKPKCYNGLHSLPELCGNMYF